MRKSILVALAVLGIACAWGEEKAKLEFNPNIGEPRSMTMVDGSEVKYTAYERLYYVTNVEDSVYQYLNIYR